ncbi:MAG TPA: RluA family pseudouridine synthase [Actinomycetota bacterium]|nr:RluA family pseudouridine synthase [Actinomycetota bacterium]
MRLQVPEEAAGSRLDVWLAEALGRRRSEVQRLIAGGLVSIDGAAPAKSLRVTAGQAVEVREPQEATRPLRAPEVPVRYEDEALAVVSKPAGLVTHPAPGTKEATLVDALKPRMPLAPAAGPNRPGIVHRLDKGTSGLLVVAKTDEAYFGLITEMKARRISRTYLALVHGTLALPRGRIEAPVGRSAKKPTAMAVRAEGKASITEFEVLESLGEVSYLRVSLLTGRTHQIRVHLAHISHPVVGDRTYGRGAEHLAPLLGLDRPFLHAAALNFVHPVSGEQVEVCEPLPPDLVEALERARTRAERA